MDEPTLWDLYEKLCESGCLVIDGDRWLLDGRELHLEQAEDLTEIFRRAVEK